VLDRSVSAVSCTHGYLSGCSKPCVQNGVRLEWQTSAGSTRECPKNRISLGDDSYCGRYWQYRTMEGGMPVCDIDLGGSDYDAMSDDCT
jgi:hypothetical protein